MTFSIELGNFPWSPPRLSGAQVFTVGPIFEPFLETCRAEARMSA